MSSFVSAIVTEEVLASISSSLFVSAAAGLGEPGMRRLLALGLSRVGEPAGGAGTGFRFLEFTASCSRPASGTETAAAASAATLRLDCILVVKFSRQKFTG